MTVHEKLAIYLEQNTNQLISGQTLAEQCNVSRQSISKAIKGLIEKGYAIDIVRNKGYYLKEGYLPLSASSINHYLNHEHQIYVYSEVTSTNDVAKQLPLEHLGCVVANKQTKGRGRLGRVFYSPENTGLYFSIYLKVESTTNTQLITAAMAVAVKRVIKEVFDIDLQIKWVNDLFYHGKKVAGILTETTFDLESQSINHVIVGIGLNLSTDIFPDELGTIAGSILNSNVVYSRNRLTASLIESIDKVYKTMSDGHFIKEYEDALMSLNKRVYYQNQEWIVRGIDEYCCLILERDGKRIIINSGEIVLIGD